jgi:hypothetical protein
MSHFSQIKTQIRNLQSLKSALTDLGHEWKAGPCEVRGYQGLTETADVAIAQENGYDIGFRWNGTEYELVTDLQYWNQVGSVDRFLKRISQRYAYHAVMTAGRDRGFQVAEEQKNADGSIRLVLQRWNG